MTAKLHWAIPDKNRTAPRMTNRLSAVVSFDTGNIQGNLLIVQGNLFRCHPWGCTIFIWNSPLHPNRRALQLKISDDLEPAIGALYNDVLRSDEKL